MHKKRHVLPLAVIKNRSGMDSNVTGEFANAFVNLTPDFDISVNLGIVNLSYP